jgi:biopolymer transport protein ExbD
MILIPFLVSMAVFTQIAIVEFSLPPAQEAGAGAAGDTQTKELDISVVITQTGFQIVGTGKKLDMMPKVQGEYQYDQLRALLKAIKFQYPSQKSVVLVFDGEIIYDDIIKFMDVCRESQFPDIGLSGDIG